MPMWKRRRSIGLGHASAQAGKDVVVVREREAPKGYCGAEPHERDASHDRKRDLEAVGADARAADAARLVVHHSHEPGREDGGRRQDEEFEGCDEEREILGPEELRHNDGVEGAQRPVRKVDEKEPDVEKDFGRREREHGVPGEEARKRHGHKDGALDGRLPHEVLRQKRREEAPERLRDAAKGDEERGPFGHSARLCDGARVVLEHNPAPKVAKRNAEEDEKMRHPPRLPVRHALLVARHRLDRRIYGRSSLALRPLRQSHRLIRRAVTPFRQQPFRLLLFRSHALPIPSSSFRLRRCRCVRLSHERYPRLLLPHLRLFELRAREPPIQKGGHRKRGDNHAEAAEHRSPERDAQHERWRHRLRHSRAEEKDDQNRVHVEDGIDGGRGRLKVAGEARELRRHADPREKADGARGDELRSGDKEDEIRPASDEQTVHLGVHARGEAGGGFDDARHVAAHVGEAHDRNRERGDEDVRAKGVRDEVERPHQRRGGREEAFHTHEDYGQSERRTRSAGQDWLDRTLAIEPETREHSASRGAPVLSSAAERRGELAVPESRRQCVLVERKRERQCRTAVQHHAEQHHVDALQPWRRERVLEPAGALARPQRRSLSAHV
mmetsp:Transcript_15387/g.50544  ORF Transcript_15387/g.50544 Transcript_15387/m.50544 type:complete len:613 (+) Transcript_15387:756-2594(+)